jgi:hypothetical protein
LIFDEPTRRTTFAIPWAAEVQDFYERYPYPRPTALARPAKAPGELSSLLALRRIGPRSNSHPLIEFASFASFELGDASLNLFDEVLKNAR